MPRARVTEVPQRPSPTGPTPRGPRHLRTLSSDSDPLLHRPLTERSPRLVDRRSPRGTQSDPVNRKKLGTRITDLETQLIQAQHELKSLKHQLTSAEAAKKQAQEELNKKGIKKPSVTRRVVRRKPPTVAEIKESNPRDNPVDIIPEDVHPETDVFEVPVEKRLVESKGELNDCPADDNKEAQPPDSAISGPENPSSCDEVASKPSSCDEAASKNEDISQLKAMVEEKKKEKQVVVEENQTLKRQLEKAKLQIASAQCKEDELVSKLTELGHELEVSKANEAQLKEKLLSVEVTKESLEIEIKKMKVQTEQWRKAADAAATVLAGGVEMNGQISERYTSMDKHFNGIFEPPINGYGGYLRSPGAGDDIDDSIAGAKKKGSGIRMLGDFWKKKGQK